MTTVLASSGPAERVLAITPPDGPHADGPCRGTKGIDLSTLYYRLAACRGRKRAIMAVAHAMVVSAFHMFSRHTPDQELGAHNVDVQQRHHLVERLTRRIEPLDDQVRLQPLPTTAA